MEHLQSDYQIVTSFYPMYLFTRNLTEGISGVTVVNMTAQNAGCLHDYQLLSKDMKALGAADAFVINGAGMEGFLEKVIEQLPSLPVITASEGIEILCETRSTSMKRSRRMVMRGTSMRRTRTFGSPCRMRSQRSITSQQG